VLILFEEIRVNTLLRLGIWGGDLYSPGIYEGHWKDNQFEEEGVLHIPNGNRYEGSFKKGKLNGPGTLIQTSGGKYEGNFLNSKCEG